jgi:NAD(P) transhydrogenase
MRYDLLVIGSGPGGFRAAIQAAKLGKKVALVEREKWGGGCTHTGTIPSKSLREAALAGRRVPFREAMERMRAVVREEAKVVHHQLERNKVQLLQGEASFLSANEIAVAGKKYAADYFVIATGARPIRHKEFNFRLAGLHDSDSLLRLKERPKRLLVAGAGVIGCEYASIFARLGTKVTLCDRRGELLRAVDHEIIAALREDFEENGVSLRLACNLGAVTKGKSSALSVEIDNKKYPFDAVLVCMGRTPNIENLALEKAGVKSNERGAIQVDPGFRTTTPHIYAVGDVIGAPALAATSAEQGRLAAACIFGIECEPFPRSYPYGIYTIPEISSIGAQELELREKNVSYVAGRAPFRELARGMIAGETRGFIKLLVSVENRQLLGVHVIGAGASELVHIGQAVMTLGAPVDFFISNVFNYPTFAEAYKVAALNAINQLRARG